MESGVGYCWRCWGCGDGWEGRCFPLCYGPPHPEWRSVSKPRPELVKGGAEVYNRRMVAISHLRLFFSGLPSLTSPAIEQGVHRDAHRYLPALRRGANVPARGIDQRPPILLPRGPHLYLELAGTPVAMFAGFRPGDECDRFHKSTR